MTNRVVSLQDVRRAPAVWSAAAMAGTAVLAVGLGKAIEDPARFRLVVAGLAGLIALALFSRSPRHLLFGLVVWLAALGLLRRLATLVAPASKTDPMLLVLPCAVALLLIAAHERGAFANRDRLANSVLVLQLLILVGAVNPLQGSIAGGVTGLLFVLVPTLGFWIGRGLLDDRSTRRMLQLVAFLALFIALYGLSQTLQGFSSWDKRWIADTSFGSLNVSGVIRPFGTLSSAAEYGTFLGIGLVLWLANRRRAWTLVVAIPAIALLATAAFLESSRGLIVIISASLGVALAAKMRMPGFVAVLLAVLALAGLGTAVRHFAPNNQSKNNVTVLTAHQLRGLSNPLDPNASTVTAHWSLLVNGFRSALHNPLGLGTGSITIAGQRFGGVAAGTELDPSNAAVGLGIPGLLAYLAVSILGFRALYRKARSGDPLSVAALAVATVMVLQWLNGGQYAVAWLPWLLLGWVDRPEAATDQQT